jgi:hypothetical protein
MPSPEDNDLLEFEGHFNAYYLSAIPRLLDESGCYLAFLSMASAIDVLAGLVAPDRGAGARFESFIADFFPSELRDKGRDLWEMRNLMVHALNPGPFALTSGQPQAHLTSFGSVTGLNAENFYDALKHAASAYFSRVRRDDELRKSFAHRVRSRDGGAPATFIVQEF